MTRNSSMTQNEKLRPYLSFFVVSLVCFWPVFLWLTAFGFIILPHELTMMRLSSPYRIRESTGQFLAYLFGAWLFPIPVLWITHTHFIRADSWKRRGWILYGGWLAFVLPVFFLLVAALGGASMAVADAGNAGSSLRYLIYAGCTLYATLWSHLFIGPWIFISIVIFKWANLRLKIWR
jgi:hypothetical protein